MGASKKSKKKKSVLKRILTWAGKVILGLFIFSILIVIIYRWVNPPLTPLMLIRKITNDAPIKQQWVDIEDISPHLIACAIAAEDNHFLGHHGFDFGAIQKAIDERKKGKRKRGASGISQQTAKNVFLWANQSWVRKGVECYFTVLIELFWSKERIMEVYLNVIEMGNGIYGCEMASQIYFHKKAKKLTLHQAALITACYPNPRKWTPSKPTSYINNRASKIARLTTLIGKISFDEENIQKARKRYKNYKGTKTRKHERVKG
ncbi:MAG: monofunctional biosynthetic peptidoglycan transglycosylase [Bacteroidales bacterium]|jgi:monofunctional biosynthetic peptidoglycan transglycosylase|nr:monofunctional biosynthetic peptidoglycan transglycosylase [Bacteroidales bacterium]